MQRNSTAWPLDTFAPAAAAGGTARRRRLRRKRGAPPPPREDLLRHVIGWVRENRGDGPEFIADVASILDMLGAGGSTEAITRWASCNEAAAPRGGGGRRRASAGSR